MRIGFFAAQLGVTFGGAGSIGVVSGTLPTIGCCGGCGWIVSHMFAGVGWLVRGSSLAVLHVSWPLVPFGWSVDGGSAVTRGCFNGNGHDVSAGSGLVGVVCRDCLSVLGLQCRFRWW